MKRLFFIALVAFACGGEPAVDTATSISALNSPQCFATCSGSASCDEFCWEGDTPSNCGAFGSCQGGCSSDCDCGDPAYYCGWDGNCHLDFGPYPECRGDCHCPGGQCVNNVCQ